MKKIPNRNSSLQTSQIVPPKVEEKENAKLVAEIYVKNKIIHELTLKNAWEKAFESQQPPDVGKLFLVLQKFKNDLEQAYEACKTNSMNILQMEKQWKIAEDEVVFLRSVLADASIDFEHYKLKQIYKDREPSRLEDLQGKFKLLQREASELEKQVQYWTNVSKKSQEAKLIAEASQSVLKKELEELKINFKSGSSQNKAIEALRAQLQSKEEELLKYADTDKKINQFSRDLEDAYASAEKMERENQSLKDNLDTKEKLIFDLKEQLTLFIDKEESLNNISNLEENYKNILNAKSDLENAKNVLAKNLDTVNGKLLAIEQENKSLYQKILDKDQELSNMDAELNDFKFLNQKLNQEREDLNNEVKNHSHEIKLLKESLLKSESFVQDLEAKLHGLNISESDKAIDQRENDKAELETALLEANEEISRLRKEIKRLDTTIKSQKNDMSSKETEIVDKSEKIEDLSNQVTQLRDSSFLNDQKDKQLLELLAKCENQYEDAENLREEVTQLKKVLEASTEESVKLKRLVSDKESAIEAINLELNNVAAELTSKEEAIQHFILQYGSLEQRNADLEKELEILGKSVNMYTESDIKDLKARNLVLEEQLADLLSQEKNIEDRITEMNELKIQEKLSKQALVIAQNNSSESKKKVSELESLLQNSESNFQVSQKKVDYYAEKLERLEKQLEIADEIVASSNSANTQLESLLSKLAASKRENEVLEEELMKLAVELEEAQSKLIQIESASPKREIVDTELNLKLEEKIKELAALNQEHKNLGNLFSILKTELDVKDSESKKLKKALDDANKELVDEKKIADSLTTELQTINMQNLSRSEKKKIDDLSDKLNASAQKNQKLESELQSLQRKLEEISKSQNSKDSELEKNVLRLEEEIKVQLAALKKKETDCRELERIIQKEKTENQSLAEIIEKADIPSLLKRVGFLENQSLEYESQLSQVLNQNKVFKSQIEDSDAVIVKLQDQLSNQNSVPNQKLFSEKKIEDLELVIESLTAKNESLIDQISKSDLDTLESVMAASKKQAEEADRAIQALSIEVSKAYQKINILTDEKADLEDEIYNLKRQNASV